MDKRRMAYLLGFLIFLFVIIAGIIFTRNSTLSPANNSDALIARQPSIDQRFRMPRMGRNRDRMNMGDVLIPPLVTADEPEEELNLPPLLDTSNQTENDLVYNVSAESGFTQLKDGELTETYGYNGSFLGPLIRLNYGDQASIQVHNNLEEPTSFHWHGLEVPSSVDGGPHTPLQAGESEVLDFLVNQEAATLWFHPHPEGNSGPQVYKGLAGLIYIEDENSKTLDIPNEYGVNDFPLIVQDRYFDENNQLNYDAFYQTDGLYGDTLLVNGTINPYVNVENEKIRLRLVNGSNARNYRFELSNGEAFHQIASDGGFLNKPLATSSLQLVPGERAEIIIDLSDFEMEDSVQLVTENVSVLTLNVSGISDEDPKPLPSVLNNIPTKEAAVQNPDKTLVFSGTGSMVSINGRQFDMDRIDFISKVEQKEVWQIENAFSMMHTMIHPFHLHGVQFRVLNRNGETPPANEQGWKDTIPLYPGESVQIEVEFSEKGIFMFHCHLLEHEDSGMMGQVLVE